MRHKGIKSMGCAHTYNLCVRSRIVKHSPYPERTFFAIPGKEKLNRIKLDVCENLAPSPPIFTCTLVSWQTSGSFWSCKVIIAIRS